MTAQDAVVLMGAIAAVGVAVDSLEVLVTRAAYADAGIYGFPMLRTGRRFMLVGPAARPLGWLLAYPMVLLLPLLQLAAAAVLIALPAAPPDAQRWLGLGACSVIVAARLVFYARNVFGQDGADQMLIVVLTSALITHAAGRSGVADVAVAYAAGQLLLAYVVSGLAKAASPAWRSGRAIVGITGTIGYGDPRLAAILATRPRVSRLLCWSVIAFECLAPLLVLGGHDGALVLAATALAFHVGIALVMGLNVFLWAFAAALPAAYFLAGKLAELR